MRRSLNTRPFHGNDPHGVSMNPQTREIGMAVKVFIKRRIKAGKTEQAIEMLKRLRWDALNQPGYISGETLVDHYDSRNLAVISMWKRVEDWIRWQESELREAKEGRLSDILELPTRYEVYDVERYIKA
jgi:heme-degrading monooxygenase HmoA